MKLGRVRSEAVDASARVRRLRLRWGVAAGIFVAAFVATRAALPFAAEWAGERAVRQNLCGALEIGDVDLDLLRSTVAVEDVRLWQSGASASGPAATEATPMVGIGRVVARVSWRELFERRVKLIDLELHRPDLRLRRGEDGSWNLLSLVCESEEEGVPAADDAGARWSFALDEAALDDGRIRFRDLTFESPLQWRAALDEVVVNRLALEPGTYDRPSTFSLEGRLDGATLALRGELRRTADARTLSLDIDAQGVPLHQASAYVGKGRTGWLRARLDLDLHLEDGGGDALSLSGDATLRDVRIGDTQDGDDERAALRAQQVSLQGARLALQERRVELDALSLLGVELPVRPGEDPPLPLLAELPFGDLPREDGTRQGAAPDGAWSVRIGTAELSESAVLLPAQDLRLAVSGRLEGLDTAADGTPADLSLDMALEPPPEPSPELEGMLTLGGALSLEPARFDGSLELSGFAFRPRDARTPCVAEIASARLEDLHAEATGSLSIGRLRLVEPVVRIARAGEAGVHCSLPDLGAQASADDGAGDGEDASLDLALRVESAEVRGGQLSFIDRDVEPFVETVLEPVAGDLTSLRLPEPAVERFALSAQGLGSKPVELQGSLEDGLLRAELDIERADLARFNPYLAKHGGLRIDAGEGSLQLEAKIELAARVTGDLHLVLHDLAVSGAGGAGKGEALGTSLPLALALLRGPGGDIVLDVPFSYEKGLAQIDLVSTIARTLHRALFNAVLTPLKLVGAVVAREGRIERIEPVSVGFQPGRTTLDVQGEAQLAKLARVLVRHPGLAVRLEPRAVEADARWLAEGGQPEVAPGGAEAFAWQGDPARLAEARGAKLVQLLERRHGVKGARVLVASPPEELRRGDPRVELHLQPVNPRA